MFLILKLNIYNYPKALNIVSKLNGLSFKYKSLLASLIRFIGEVNNGRLLGFERYATPPFLV